MGVTVRDDTVIFVAIPPMRLGVPYTAVAFEFINTDSLREVGWPTEVDGVKGRLDGALGDVVPPCDLGEGKRLYQIQENGVFDDTVVGTTVRTDPLPGYRYIERDKIVVFEDLDAFDSCFLWQFCQIVGCFYICFRYPLKCCFFFSPQS